MSKQNVMPMLAVLYGSAFVAAFNENIINVALVSIMGTFSVGADTAQWLVTGYMVVTAIIVTVTAFLFKRLHLRTLFFAAALFLVGGSLACLAAPTFPLLLAARLAQAVGTGIFIPAMMSTVLMVAPRKRLGTYLSIGSCMITFGPAFAPVVSGLMVTAFGWRSVFVPAAVLVSVLALAGAVCIKNIAEPEKIKLDVVSVALSAVGLFALVYGLSTITANLPVAMGALAVGACGIAWFVVRQGRLENPLLDLRPLRNPRFSTACGLVVVAMMTTFSMSVLLPLYFEGALGMTALASGALLLAPILVNAATALLGGRTMDRRGIWPLLPCGFALIAAGQLAICLVAPGMSWVAVLAGSVVVYAGVGFIFSPSQTAGLQTLEPEQNPHGVAIINTFIQVAACIGPSLFIGVLSSTAAGATAGGASAVSAQANGFSAAVAVAAVVAAIGLVASFVYARRARVASEPRADASTTPLVEPGIDAVMKRDAFTIPATASVLDAMRVLIERKTSGVPVVDERGSVVGFISDGDIMKALTVHEPTGYDLAYGLAIYRHDEEFSQRLSEVAQLNVMELATDSVVCVPLNASIEDACATLSAKRIKKAPVIRDGALVGTISRSDVVRQLMASYAEVERA